MAVLTEVSRALLQAPSSGKARVNFSTARAMLAKRPGVPHGNPELPSFRIGDIVSTRRGRIIFYSLFAVLATAESLTWLNLAPRVFGGDRTDGEQREPSSGR